MTAAILPWPLAKFFQPNTNLPLAGGKVYTYAAGTSTPLATYSDSAGTIPNTNPVILDANGQANIYLANGLSYKVNLLDASNIQVPDYPIDNIVGSDSSGMAASLVSALRADLGDPTDITKGDALIAVKQPFTGAVARTQHDKNIDALSVLDFMTDAQKADVRSGAAAVDVTAAIIACAIAAAAAGKSVYAPGGNYRLDSSVAISGVTFTLMGDGQNVTYFTYMGTGTAFAITPGDISRVVAFCDCTIIAGNASAASGTAISVTYPSFPSWVGPTVLIDKVSLYSTLTGASFNYWTTGIYLFNAWNAVITNTRFSGKPNDFTTSASFINLDTNCTDIIIDKCHAYFCTYAVLASGYAEGLQINNCVFVAVDYGFKNTAASILGPRITSSHINANLIDIDLTNASQFQIAHNLLYCAYTPGISNISLVDCHDGIIDNNIMIGTGTSCNGVTCAASATDTARNQITNNSIQVTGQPVWFKAGSVSNYASNNRAFLAGVPVEPYLEQGTNDIQKRTWGDSFVHTMTGGATSEIVDVVIPQYAFVGKPLSVVMTEAAATQFLIGFYNYDYASNSSTLARVVVKRLDGANITAGGVRFSVIASD